MKSITRIALASVLVFALATSVLAQESESKESTEKAKESTEKATPEAKGPKEEKTVRNPIVKFETNYGDIKVELFQKEAPISVKNFLGYVTDGFYDGTIFHRVIKGFVLQAGGMTADMKQKERKDPIKSEATNGLSNKRGTLSMARSSDINSGSSHFFINLVDNARLDHTGDTPSTYGYAVFGAVADDASMKVVDKIAQVSVTTKGNHQNVPVEPVTIKRATVVSDAESTKKTAEKETKQESVDKVKKEQKQMKED